MPTSNGQVTSRDLRQRSVKTLHIVDDNVTTPKIADLAVTFPDKIDDPIFSAVGESARFHNVSFTTTLTEWAALAFDLPAWVNQIFVFAVATGQMTNSSGGQQDLVIATGFEGVEPFDEQQTAVLDGDVGSITHVQTFATPGVAGATVTVEIWAKVTNSTNSSNNGEVNAILVGTR